MRNNSSNALIESYSYDAFHNRKQRSAGASTDYYVYDSAQQLLEIRATTATGSLNKAFVYDSVGNMTRTCEGGTVTRSASACSGTTSLTLGYNNLNQLSTASKTGLASESYRYDGLGNRIEKVVGSSPQRFVYNGATIFTEYNASWTTAQASHVLGGLDIPLMRAKAIGQGDYYHPDGMGSIVISTNEADTITGKRVYNAWGTVSTSSGSVATYGFVGREPDATGLIYLRARYYDPDTGRFTQADPLGFIDGINRYTYAKNSPVNFVDPWGTMAREPSGVWDAASTYFSNNSSLIQGIGEGFVGGTVGTALFFATLGNSADVDITRYIFGAPTDQDQVDGRVLGSLFGVGGAISVASKTSLARSLPGPAATIAEEASVANTAGTRGYRYVSEAEVQAIKDTGMLRGGKSGETYFTKDVYTSAAQAQERLSLPNAPSHRVEFEISNDPMLMRNGTKVDPVGPHSGGGAEFMTTDPVRVNLINVQPLR